jgi:spore coat protein U-like protein
MNPVSIVWRALCRRGIATMLAPLCVLLFLLPGQARADTCTATMTDVVFGSVNPIDTTDPVVAGTLSVSCSWTALTGIPPLLLFPNVTFCATLGGTRSMLNGTNALPFGLYTDSTYSPTSAWGAGAAGGATSINGTMGGLLALGTISKTFTVYGKISGATLSGVKTVGNLNTDYVADLSGAGVLQFAFYGLTKPACTAGSSTTFSFKARATAINDCRITAGQIAFGTTRVLSAAVRTNTNIGVQCTSGSAYQIALNAGNYASGSVRRMKNAGTGEMVRYELSATYDGANWGDGSTGVALGGTGNGSVQSLPLYSRVVAQVTPSPGDYKDTVTATLYF